MRRRRNQSDARYRVTHARDDFIDFMAGKLSTFAGFRALRHLDLKFIRAYQIFTGDAKPRRCNLLDRARAGITVRIQHVSSGIFAALAGIAAAANAVHRNGECFVRFLADRTE